MIVSRHRIATVVPLHNGSDFVVEALESVFGQTRQSDRVVVVDDGSSDDGVDAIARAFPQHGIEVLQTVNGGQSRARNLGVQAASDCDLIAFLDQDDAWYPEHLEVLEGVFLKSSLRRLAYVYSNLDQIDREGRRIHQSLLDLIDGPRQKTKIYDLIGLDVFVLPSASLVDRTAFLSVGGFDEQLSGYEDDDLFVRLFLAGFDHAYVATPLSQWRIYGDSCSQSPRMRISRLRYAMKLIGMFPKDPAGGLDFPRDVVWPRFSKTLRQEIKRMMMAGNRRGCNELADDLICIAKATNRYDVKTWLKVANYRIRALLSAA